MQYERIGILAARVFKSLRQPRLAHQKPIALARGTLPHEREILRVLDSQVIQCCSEDTEEYNRGDPIYSARDRREVTLQAISKHPKD